MGIWGLKSLPDKLEALLAVVLPRRDLLLKAVRGYLQGTDRLLQGLFECAPYRHDLAHRFHLRAEDVFSLRKFFKGKTRDLDHHIVNGRLETGRGLPGDVIGDLIQGIADRQFGCDLGYRKPGGLTGQGRASGNPRVHLDHHQTAIFGMDGKLDIRSPGIHPNFTDHLERGVAHDLILFIREGLGWGYGDRVSRMYPHRVKILDGADDHHVVFVIAHHFELKLFPPQDRLLDQHLMDWGNIDPPSNHFFKILRTVGDVPPAPTQCTRGADDYRETELPLNLHGLPQVSGITAARQIQSCPLHRLFKEVSVFGLLDGLQFRPDHLHPVAIQDPLLRQVNGDIQGRLPSQGREQGIRPLLLDNLFHNIHGDRLDVGPVGETGVGHDRGGIRVDQDNAKTLFLECLQSLRAGIVELTCLADDDRS